MRLSIVCPNIFLITAFFFCASFQSIRAQNEDDTLSVPERGAENIANSASPSTVIPAANLLYDTIAGPLPDSVKAHEHPYLVVGDIEVPANKKVIIEAGSILLFKNFTGIRVLGKMEALGTKERPIVFTSENDRSVNPATTLYPNPYDWNGISIQKSGMGTALSYCNIFYSVFGIESETKFIRLDPVTLRFNGKSNLVIDGKSRTVTDQAYYYVLSTNDAIADGISPGFFKAPNTTKRSILRYSCYTLIVASLIGGIDSGLHFNKDRKNLIAMSSNDPTKLSDSNESDWIALRDSRDRYRNLTIAYTAIFALSAAGFSWTFTF